MITDLSSIYDEVLARCGEGYSNLKTRAKDLFWLSVGILIRNREFTTAEIAGLTTIDEIEVELTDFPQDILENITDQVFDVEVKMLVGGPANAIFTYVNPDDFDSASIARKSQNRLTKLPEIIWTIKNQMVLVSFDSQDVQFESGYAFIQRTIYSIANAHTADAGDKTPFNTFFNYSFAARAIELTVPALLQEVKG